MGCGASIPQSDQQGIDNYENVIPIQSSVNDEHQTDENFASERNQFWQTRIEGNLLVWRSLRGLLIRISFSFL